jgi:hypothetical protein
MPNSTPAYDIQDDLARMAENTLLLCRQTKPDSNYDVKSIEWLDHFIEYLRDHPDLCGPKGFDSLAAHFGAYLGETVRRHYGGEWVRNPVLNEVGIQFDNGLVFLPFVKVRKQYYEGHAGRESIANSFKYSIPKLIHYYDEQQQSGKM